MEGPVHDLSNKVGEPKPAETGRERFAFAGMLFGIGSIPLLYPWPLALVRAIIGLCLSAYGLKSNRRGMAIAGLMCSALVLGLFALMTIEELLA